MSSKIDFFSCKTFFLIHKMGRYYFVRLPEVDRHQPPPTTPCSTVTMSIAATNRSVAPTIKLQRRNSIVVPNLVAAAKPFLQVPI